MPSQPVPTLKSIWAYAYEISPPQPERLLRGVRTLLDAEATAAKIEGRVWVGRIVHEQVVSHILVVADTPDQDRSVNAKLTDTLGELGVFASVTTPLAVAEDAPPVPPPT